MEYNSEIRVTISLSLDEASFSKHVRGQISGNFLYAKFIPEYDPSSVFHRFEIILIIIGRRNDWINAFYNQNAHCEYD